MGINAAARTNILKKRLQRVIEYGIAIYFFQAHDGSPFLFLEPCI